MLQQFMFKRNNINNGILSNQRAMPQKDSTSDGNNTFAAGRLAYVETANAINSLSQTQKMEKKWYGNRDSSTVTANRRTMSIGKGSINDSNTPLSFTTTNDNNTAREAIIRVRAGGAVVPQKCINTPGTAGVVCYGGCPNRGTKPNQNSDRTKAVLMRRANLGCDVPYDCLNKSAFCKTHC
jgi:hypothetical protein